MVVKFKHSANMDCIKRTFAVLKLLRSNLVSAQPLNMLRISITFSVLKLDTSSIFNEEQRLNIYAMSVTFEVLKLDRSSEESDGQP